MIELPKLLNKAELARQIFPSNDSAPVLLNMKLKGTNRNRITEDDKEAILKAIDKARKEIECM